MKMNRRIIRIVGDLANMPPLGLKAPKAKPNPGYLAKVRELPAPQELRSLVQYDSETGIVSWLARTECITGRKGEVERWNARFAGRTLGTLSHYGYLVACIFDRQIKVHRLAYAIHHRAWPKGQIDHINGNKTDNRAVNLRDVDARQNALNRKVNSRNKTGIVGVCKTRYGTFLAYISTHSGREHLGTFKCFGLAIKARRRAEADADYHPNHGRR